MAALDYVRLEGASTANRILKDLEFKVRRRIVTAAVRAGCRELIKEVRARCPVDRGHLKKQFRTSVKMQRATGQVIGKVKPKPTKGQRAKGQGHAGRYLHFVVGGTKPHQIPKPGRQAVMLVGGQPYSRIDHPGARPRPFMDEAARFGMPHAMRAFTLKMDERMRKELLKIRATT